VLRHLSCARVRLGVDFSFFISASVSASRAARSASFSCVRRRARGEAKVV
jgi:hypothetical protein